MNIFLGLIALILCTFLGYRFSNKYTEKLKFYNEFYDFNNYLIGEMTYSLTTLDKISLKFKGEFGKSLNEYLLLKDKYKVQYRYLSEEEKIYVKNYFSFLGTNDKDTQNKFLLTAVDNISEKKKLAEIDSQKYKKLYLKIGFLIGLIILIALM